MIVHMLKTCDTCRKALAALKAAGFTPQVVDVRADGWRAPTCSGSGPPLVMRW